MKKKLLAMLAQKSERKAAIATQADTVTDVTELRKLNDEMDTINKEIRSLEEMIATTPDEPKEGELDERTAAVTGTIPGVVVANTNAQRNMAENGDVEKRIDTLAAELRSGAEVTISNDVQQYLEKRAIATSNVLLENKYKREVADNFNVVAQTIDLVDAFPLDGGNQYEVSFALTDGDADYSAEGAAYTNSEGTFGVSSTGRAKITNSAVVNEEVIDLPNADYLTKIVNSVRKSIRKKVSNQIIAGAGGANQLKGIYNAPVVAIPASYKIGISAIDKDSLRKIVFAYGGDEDVESPMTLFLNKLDLAAFAAVMATGDGRPYYSIEYNGSNGFIQEVGGGLRVPYTINSGCNALSAAATVTGTKTMIYGAPSNYELPMFSPLTIKRSDERYIDEGKIGFFGKIIAGGVVNKYKGFIPVEKIAAV